MRCSSAVIQALIMHPRFNKLSWVEEEAISLAKSNIVKNADYRFTSQLSVELAYNILNVEIQNIVKTQKSTGGWKTKDSKRLSFWLLIALKHSGLLEELLKENKFKYDPFKLFKEDNDFFSYIMRRDILNKPLKSDEELREILVEEIFAKQTEEGSWNGTVLSSCNHIDSLLFLNQDKSDLRLSKAVDWLFGNYKTDVIRNSNNLGGITAAHNMFTSDNRWKEFESAADEKPEWLPRQLCYNHLPMIQTGAAIKTLILLGYSEDERVISSCENLIRMKELYGGWCDTNVRNALKTGISKVVKINIKSTIK